MKWGRGGKRPRRLPGTGSQAGDEARYPAATTGGPKESGDCPHFSTPAGGSLASRLRGSLIAGALGDALGAPIEFLSLAGIRERYGTRGLERLAPAYGVRGAITDDTQMTLFTVEGLIRAGVRGEARGISHPPSVVHHAYRRWLWTQGERWDEAGRGGAGQPAGWEPDGWLVGERFLHARRAPGNTCLAALRVPGPYGVAAENDSKGCGGVMRIAPVGFLFPAGLGAAAFRTAIEVAALTHGHPTGQLAAGVVAAAIHAVAREGLALVAALDAATALLRAAPGHAETLAALARARTLAEAGSPTAEKVESLGGGWVAEEALAIAVYAALSYPDDLGAALVLAANHSGDSDSTAAICGHLLGAVCGEAGLPADGLGEPGGPEGRLVIERLADDFARQLAGEAPDVGGHAPPTAEAEVWRRRYPGS